MINRAMPLFGAAGPTGHGAGLVRGNMNSYIRNMAKHNWMNEMQGDLPITENDFGGSRNQLCKKKVKDSKAASAEAPIRW